jgi:hypothetical protein
MTLQTVTGRCIPAGTPSWGSYGRWVGAYAQMAGNATAGSYEVLEMGSCAERSMPRSASCQPWGPKVSKPESSLASSVWDRTALPDSVQGAVSGPVASLALSLGSIEVPLSALCFCEGGFPRASGAFAITVHLL